MKVKWYEIMNSIIFRADCDKSLDMGHIVRCLAIVDTLKKKHPDLKFTFLIKYKYGKK